MTELINQLVEEMKEIEPKYTLIKIECNGDDCHVCKLCKSNDKEQLKRKMLEIVIKDNFLEKYLKPEILSDCRILYITQYGFQSKEYKSYIEFSTSNAEYKIEIDNGRYGLRARIIMDMENNKVIVKSHYSVFLVTYTII